MLILNVLALASRGTVRDGFVILSFKFDSTRFNTAHQQVSAFSFLLTSTLVSLLKSEGSFCEYFFEKRKA